MNEFGFDERLAFSEGICNSTSAATEGILRGAVKGCVNVRRAGKAADRSGTDYWVDVSDRPEAISIDVKVREKDYKPAGWDDLALETFSDIDRSVIGWTRDSKKRTDYILWIWEPTGRWCLVPFLPLCAVFARKWEVWSGQFRTARQHTVRGSRSWFSECVFVPRNLVWRAIYDHCHGHMKTRPAGLLDGTQGIAFPRRNSR